ncbi:uncharacterized protein LOC121856851 isoform X2 [Homarus americanus]|uniref:uncharacterized protein LOC121856851 isoform X2 n=1 Tax=Homarus americanus TaxID=6706 RepID=UPI001C4694BA|nr:uncharacterized protein LOC121856851 isoform X2 [Homarus americanus]
MRRGNLRLVTFLAVGVLAWFNLLFLLFRQQQQQLRPEDVLLDPNAPVILVADDSKDEDARGPLPALSPLPQALITTYTPTNTTRQSRVHLKPGALANRFLVHSYDHGGGGVVSEALNLLLDEIFFLYQPLYKLGSQGLTRVHLLKKEKTEEGIEWLRGVFNCSFNQRSDLLHEPFLFKSHSVRNTYNNYCHNHQVGLLDCVQLACQQRPLQAMYIVHLSMFHILQLLNMYSSKLKMVVVLRDPRAVLGARRRAATQINLNNPADFKTQASLLCGAMVDDLGVAYQLRQQYPQSVMVLRYEHLLLKPHHVLSYLYDFLGLQVTHHHLNSVIKTLRLDLSEQTLLQITKIWQLDLNLQESRAVDIGCFRHYHKLGYQPVPTSINTRNNYVITWDQAQIREEKLKSYKLLRKTSTTQ